MTPTVAVLVALAMCVVVPVGLPLLATPGVTAVRRAWPVVGGIAVVSLPLPPGTLAGALTLPYLALTAALAVRAVQRTTSSRTGRREPRVLLRELTALTAGGSPVVAAACLTAERAGIALLGFEPAVLALTVAHFHYAGFAVALLAGLALVRVPGSTTALAAAAVPVGTALVAAGHLTGRAVELAGAVVVAAGVLALSLATVRRMRTSHRGARRLLLVSAAVTPLTMALALWWAVGRLAGLPHPDLALMGATHGVGNAVGLSLCGLLGWRLLRAERL